MKTRLKIFKSNFVAVLLYGCETWRMTKRDANKLDKSEKDYEDLLAYENIKRGDSKPG